MNQPIDIRLQIVLGNDDVDKLHQMILDGYVDIHKDYSELGLLANYAADVNAMHSLKLLVKLGIDLTKKDWFKCNAIHCAASLDCFQYLIALGLNPADQDRYGNNALLCYLKWHATEETIDLEIVKLLIPLININATSQYTYISLITIWIDNYLYQVIPLMLPYINIGTAVIDYLLHATLDIKAFKEMIKCDQFRSALIKRWNLKVHRTTFTAKKYIGISLPHDFWENVHAYSEIHCL